MSKVEHQAKLRDVAIRTLPEPSRSNLNICNFVIFVPFAIFVMSFCQDDIHNPWTLGSTKNSTAKCPGRPSRNYECLVRIPVEVVRCNEFRHGLNQIESLTCCVLLCFVVFCCVSADCLNSSLVSDPRHCGMAELFCSRRCFNYSEH